MSTFTVSSAFFTGRMAAVKKVDEQFTRSKLPGFSVTGRTFTSTILDREIIHVECVNKDGDAHAMWVHLTSYGLSPSTDLCSSLSKAADRWPA